MCLGQEGERYVKRFHGPDRPPQEIRRVHSSARINQEFGPRVNVTSKMVDKLQASKQASRQASKQASKHVRSCGSMHHVVRNLLFEFSCRFCCHGKVFSQFGIFAQLLVVIWKW